MAFSPLRFKTLQHGRSLSLPSKSQSATPQLDESLFTIKGSEATFSSLPSFNNRVNGLTNLYRNINESLLSPHFHQIISQEPQEKWVDQVLDGHVRLLDACSTAKDLFSQVKHDTQELLSALRRKDVDGVQSYLNSRRKSKKLIQKFLKNLRSKYNGISLEKENETMTLVCMLKEAESDTFAMLESSLCYMMGTKTQARQSGWSLVSKLMHSKKVSHQGKETDFNEFKRVDDFLLMEQDNDARIEELKNHLKEMDSSIQVLEENLECFYRQLIKTRVSLLNILNH